MPDIQISDKLLNFLIFLPIFFLSLSVHEFAHAFSASKLGDNTAKKLGRATLNPFKHIDLLGSVIMPLASFASGLLLIGWAKPVPINRNNFRNKRRDDIIVTSAGPLSNLAIAFIVGVATASIGSLGLSEQFFAIIKYSIYLNIFLCLFNLLPIPPLDGSKIFANLFPIPALQSFMNNGLLGSLLLMFFVFSPLWQFFFGLVNLVVQQFFLMFNF